MCFRINHASIFIVCLAFFFCANSSVKSQEDYNQFLVKDIRIDTTYGYPYPQQINWSEYARIGMVGSVPKKNKYSPIPLIDIDNHSKFDTYRINMQVYRFLFTTDSTSKSLIIEKATPFPERSDGFWKYDSNMVYNLSTTTLTTNQWKQLMLATEKTNFWKMASFDKTRINSCFDGDNWVFEGIKNGYYHFVFRDCVDEKYEMYFSHLGRLLLKYANQ